MVACDETATGQRVMTSSTITCMATLLRGPAGRKPLATPNLGCVSATWRRNPRHNKGAEPGSPPGVTFAPAVRFARAEAPDEWQRGSRKRRCPICGFRAKLAVSRAFLLSFDITFGIFGAK